MKRKNDYFEQTARNFSEKASPELKDIIYVEVKQALQQADSEQQYGPSQRLPWLIVDRKISWSFRSDSNFKMPQAK